MTALAKLASFLKRHEDYYAQAAREIEALNFGAK